MKRYIPVAFGLTIIALTLLGTRGVNTSLDTFLTTNELYAGARLSLAVVLVVCGLFARGLQSRGRILLRLVGLIAIILGTITVFSPTYLGVMPSFTLMLDTLIALEGGIICLLASVAVAPENQPAKQSIFVYRPNRHFLSKGAARLSFHDRRPYTTAH